MSWGKAVLGEIFALFVDDGAFAIAILLWLGAVGELLAPADLPPVLKGLALFLGLAAILVDSALRRARK